MGAAENLRGYKSYSWLVQDERLLGGRLAVRGTRMPVALILELLASGWTADDLEAEYPGWPRESMHDILAAAAELAEQARLPGGAA